jgi:signal transduction histidine kinase
LKPDVFSHHATRLGIPVTFSAQCLRQVRELREAVTRKDQFMSLVSHELRTPLNGIIQLSESLYMGAGEYLCAQWLSH